MAEGAAYNTEGVDSVMHVKHARSVVEEKTTRQGHAQGERPGVPQDDEGQLERTRAECQERADTEPKRTMRLEKPPEEELLPEVRLRCYRTAAGCLRLICSRARLGGKRYSWPHAGFCGNCTKLVTASQLLASLPPFHIYWREPPPSSGTRCGWRGKDSHRHWVISRVRDQDYCTCT